MLAASHCRVGLRKWFGEEGRCPQNSSLQLLLSLGDPDKHELPGASEEPRPLRIREGILLGAHCPSHPGSALCHQPFCLCLNFPLGPPWALLGPMVFRLIHLFLLGASLVAQRVKNPPAMQETRVRPLGREDSPVEGHGNPLQCSFFF